MLELLMLLLSDIIDFSNIEDIKPLTVEEKRIEKIESDKLIDLEYQENMDFLDILIIN